MNDIEFIQHMQKLEVQPGDIVVLRTQMALSEKAAANLRDAVRQILNNAGFNNTVMIIEEGMEIGVLRKSASE